MFSFSDFELFNPQFQGDVEWNERRLNLRRRLQKLGTQIQDDFSNMECDLDRRESLHHPHRTNGKRVRRQRTMLFRSKKDRKKLQTFLGKELGKDLDSVRNNAHLQICIDRNEMSWGLRIDSSAWYDLNVLIKRAEEENTRTEIVTAAHRAAHFDLIFNRASSRLLSSTTSRDWRDIAGTICPGEHSMEVVRKMSANTVVERAGEIDSLISRDLSNLKDFFFLCNWTLDSPNGATA